ncbi:MAG TPA: ribonuclease D, partial [Aggregatilineales bacterium]|nr:ribonuclease D [Aggregatilineales bacterium]
MTTSLPPIQMIDSDQSLLRLVERLANEALIAVDTESNSLYAYYERVCLIQISTQTGDWVIDPLALDDLSPLGTIFADPHIEKVFHAAEYDLMCLKRDYEFIFLNLFDTMVTARILGRKAIGLGSLLEDYFDLHMDKRFQKANWSERPLPKDMLRYAQKDTHYLPALRDKLYEELVGRGLLEEALDVFATFAALTP